MGISRLRRFNVCHMKSDLNKLKKEKDRVNLMYQHQLEISGNVRFCFGIDEAGRGPLCGPVCAACCLLPYESQILYLNDSKKLSEKKRDVLYDDICKNALAYGIFLIDVPRIDEINILNATLEAMKGAFDRCYYGFLDRTSKSSPKGDMEKLRASFDDIPGLSDSLVLIDGVNKVPGIFLRQKTLVKGDAICPSISAASILAKVTRDRLMLQADIKYPGYGFAKNKGYGTLAHIEALRKYGPIPGFHRKNFIKKLIP